jgi:NAD(P)-dependent dehydrogenase (short-subunit alcohol dehydrogenase family)
MNSNSKIALVTGATRGIGRETVRQLAEAGVHTLLAGRDPARASNAALDLQLDGLPVEALTLDVTDAGSIAAAAKEVEKRHGRLDILVNNAGVLLDAPDKAPSEQSPSVWRETFDTNLFAAVEATRAFLPLLRQSPAGRIVNVSSIIGSIALHSDPSSGLHAFRVPAYGVSKSALNAWTVYLAHELRDTPIKVNAIHPGSVKTDMNSQGSIDVQLGAKSSVDMALLGADGPSGSFTHLGEVLPW